MLAVKLALKFLFTSKKEKFISVNTFLALGSVALSVLVLIVVIGVMTGLGTSLREKIMTMTPHLLIFSEKPLMQNINVPEKVKTIKNVEAVSPYILGPVELRYLDKSYSITIRGLSPDEGFKIINLKQYIKLGSKELKPGETIIGTELAKMLNVQTGDKLKLRGPNPGFDFKEVTITSIFESGLYSYDKNLIFISLIDAQHLYGFESQVHGFGVRVKNPEEVSKVKDDILKKLGTNLTIRTWIEDNKPFFSALQTEKNVMFILLAFAVLIAAINIISTLVMLVMEKYSDIGILKAIGFTKQTILNIFLIQGFTIGLIGTGAGAIFGILFVKNINTIENLLTKYTGLEVFPSDTYYFDSIPTCLNVSDITLILSLAMIVSILASIYPAIKASRLSAVEALHYE